MEQQAHSSIGLIVHWLHVSDLQQNNEGLKYPCKVGDGQFILIHRALISYTSAHMYLL